MPYWAELSHIAQLCGLLCKLCCSKGSLDTE